MHVKWTAIVFPYWAVTVLRWRGVVWLGVHCRSAPPAIGTNNATNVIGTKSASEGMRRTACCLPSATREFRPNAGQSNICSVIFVVKVLVENRLKRELFPTPYSPHKMTLAVWGTCIFKFCRPRYWHSLVKNRKQAQSYKDRRTGIVVWRPGNRRSYKDQETGAVLQRPGNLHSLIKTNYGSLAAFRQESITD